MSYELKNIGSLEVIEVPPQVSPQKEDAVIVVLHGYGANAYDLAELCKILKVPPGTKWLIPNGPLQVNMGAFYDGRAWAPINMVEWHKAMREGRPRDLSGERPPELIQSQKLILKMLEIENVDLKNVIYLGFSQGAMLSTQLTIMSKVPPKGLVILSGSLINAEEWRKHIKHLQNFKYFQSHGRFDEVLSYQGALNLSQLLQEGGLAGSLLTFDGGHEIPPLVVQKIQNYLYEILPQDLWKGRAH